MWQGGRQAPPVLVMRRGCPMRGRTWCVRGACGGHGVATKRRSRWEARGSCAARRWLSPSQACRGPGCTDAQETEQPLMRLKFQRRGVWAAGAVEKHREAAGAHPGRCPVPGGEHRVGRGDSGPACTQRGRPGTVPSREEMGAQPALYEGDTCCFKSDSKMPKRKGRPRRQQTTGLGPG